MAGQKSIPVSSRKTEIKPRAHRHGKAATGTAIQQWKRETNCLLGDISDWAKSRGWIVARADKELTEESLGTYTVSDLNIKVPGGVLIVEVRGRNVVGAEGRVDVYS